MAPTVRYCICCAAPLAPVDEGGALRQRCTAPGCGWTWYNNPVPVVAAIVEHDGHVLLVRSAGWAEGMYGLVTGFLERGESPEQAVLREVHEELSLEAEVVSFIGMYPFEAMNQLLLVFHLRAVSGEVTLGDELVGYRRIAIHKLRPWSFGTGPAVADWLAQREESAP